MRTTSISRDTILHGPMRTESTVSGDNILNNPLARSPIDLNHFLTLPLRTPSFKRMTHSSNKSSWQGGLLLKPQLLIYLIHALRKVFLNPLIKGFNFLIGQGEIIVVSTYLGDINEDLE